MNNSDADLNFPIIREMPRTRQALSMDDYDRFNVEGLEFGFDREAYLKEKKKREVHVPFVLDE
ncbi:MAG: hypothetical protein ACOC41_06920 [Chitinivibrionales bacterium]